MADGEWSWARHPTLTGKQLAYLPADWTRNRIHEQQDEFVSKRAAHYTEELNKRLAVVMSKCIKQGVTDRLNTKLHRVRTTVGRGQSHHHRRGT